MKSKFSFGVNGIEFKIVLTPREERTLYTLKLKSVGFRPTGIRIAGTRLYEVMISNITLGQTSLTTTPFSLSTIQSFKSYVDGRVKGEVISIGESLSFLIENRGNSTLAIKIYIDGTKEGVNK